MTRLARNKSMSNRDMGGSAVASVVIRISSYFPKERLEEEAL